MVLIKFNIVKVKAKYTNRVILNLSFIGGVHSVAEIYSLKNIGKAALILVLFQIMKYHNKQIDYFFLPALSYVKEAENNQVNKDGKEIVEK